MKYLLLLLLLPALAFGCGKERWPVKTGTDKDAARVVLIPKTMALWELANLPVPGHHNPVTNARLPEELETVTVQAMMTLIKLEKDEDYHIVITDAAGHTMIVEAPAPHCAKGSHFANQIAQVRKTIEAHFGGAVHGRHVTNIPVTVMGVVFWDHPHSQEGVAKNAIELHPLLAIKFH
jgi:hypothetical protein